MMRALLLCLLVGLPMSAFGKSQLICHYSYGGTTSTVRSPPQSDPYSVEPMKIGSYFLFRPVFEHAPMGLSAIKLYTYVNRDSGPVIIHQASFAYPAATHTQGIYGFTGLQRVYEPVRDSELSYWCEIGAAP
jgi:hypothetical protein